jgi:predicted O-linked N-acetylglucosamine transferase (SPINDLY family)
VVLDSYPFGMGVTALEAFAMGTPVVSLPSYQVQLHRLCILLNITVCFHNHYTQSVPPLVLGMLRKMNLDDTLMIAHSPSEYVDNAITIAASAQERGRIVAALRSSAAILYDDGEVVGEWETMLANLHGSVNQGKGTQQQ